MAPKRTRFGRLNPRRRRELRREFDESRDQHSANMNIPEESVNCMNMPDVKNNEEDTEEEVSKEPPETEETSAASNITVEAIEPAVLADGVIIEEPKTTVDEEAKVTTETEEEKPDVSKKVDEKRRVETMGATTKPGITKRWADIEDDD